MPVKFFNRFAGFAALFCFLFVIASCGGGEKKGGVLEWTQKKKEQQKKDTIPFVNPTKVSDRYVKSCPLSPDFGFPVGRPDKNRHLDTAGYYKARGFLGMEHLGEDWNRSTGGNSDLGNFVYAVANGIVIYSYEPGEGWGQVVRMLHNAGSEEKPEYVESVYAHLNSVFVQPGNVMKKGDVLGTIGTAKGKYHAHLHFEIRGEPGKNIQAGYDGDTAGFKDPTIFIDAHREEK